METHKFTIPLYLFTLLLFFNSFKTIAQSQDIYIEATNKKTDAKINIYPYDVHTVALNDEWVYRVKKYEGYNEEFFDGGYLSIDSNIETSGTIQKSSTDKPLNDLKRLDTTGKDGSNVIVKWNTLDDSSNPHYVTINLLIHKHTELSDDGSGAFETDGDPYEDLIEFTVNVTNKLYVWYPDSDGDGFGDPIDKFDTTTVDTPPYAGAVKNNNDKCPNEKSYINNGCFEDINYTLNKTYDINGNLTSTGIAYFNNLGKPIQSQTKDLSTGRTWATQTLYDSQGRPALQTLSAPVREQGDFLYEPKFFTNAQNTAYTNIDFETNPKTPAVAGKAVNTLGHYYSSNNTTQNNTTDNHRLKGNTYQDITAYPFSRTIYSKLNPGTPLKVLGGNKQNGTWKQAYVFSMPAGDALSRPKAFNHPSYTTSNGSMKLIKTISRDVHGTETVAFTDTDGRSLAAARTGGNTSRDTKIKLGAQGYVDVHVPVDITGFSLENLAGRNVNIYNLITETLETAATTSLPNGFYRVAVTKPENYNDNNPIFVKCKENYYDYSLNKYDNVGRMIKSYQPLNKLESTYAYNALGQLTHTKSPDEGEAWFKYRKDGQIRFSQNTKQRYPNNDGNTNDQEFSYTNYDNLGRPIESGVAKGNFANLNPDIANFTAQSKSEQQFTVYDSQTIPTNQTIPSQTFNTALNNLGLNTPQKQAVYKPRFLAGNVAITYTIAPETTTTWYSYDVYGRVEWVIQNINGLGIKTINYQYNPITGAVTKVDFQKYKPDERYIHRYTYHPADHTLLKVETSTNNATYTTQANYKYYETGALKRLELAPLNNTGTPLQGIDYVYNLSGQLKAINHPSLTAANDPGNDANDLFGMQIDYHSNDYNRTGNNISTANYGKNQYNGNIKGIRWNNQKLNNKQETYSYHYNKENWLTDAIYGQYDNSNNDGSKININDANNYQGVNKTLNAKRAITLLPGFHAKPNSGQTVSAKIVSGQGSAFQEGDYNVFDITYDANGNIQTLNRNKNTANGSNVMDQLGYIYNPEKPNQLKRVTDAVGTVKDANDIENQTQPNNYQYNAIGQLIKNNTENITYLYNTSGLVKEIHNTQQTIKFFYNDKNHRVRKEVYINNNLDYTEHYVRDAAGTALAIYKNKKATEHTIYGASRLGVHYRANGNNVYQITDHLGNVRAVVERNNSNNIAALVATDYYPFGMPMPNRDNGANSYRYKYQGQEVDPETGKEAFELRLWDSRIGRWLTTDPAGQFASPYLGMGNNPIRYNDKRGDSIRISFRDGFLGVFGEKHILTYDQNQGAFLENGEVYTGELSRFQTASLNDLNRLYKDPDGKNYIDYLANHKKDLWLKSGSPNSNTRDNFKLYYTGADMRTSDVNVGELSFIQPSYQILGHEIYHRFTQFKGFPNPRWGTNPFGQDEKRAVHFENLLRSRNGDVLREFYDRTAPDSRIIKEGTRTNMHNLHTY